MTSHTGPYLDHLHSVPVFPLPELVFFPNTGLPLHVFEPRYRAMTRHCLEHRTPMAVGRIKAPLQAAASGRGPEVVQVVTLGDIIRSQPLPDGRFHILLGGVRRIRLVEELHTDEPFRRFRAQPLDDVWPDDPAVAPDKLLTLKNCLMSVQQQVVRIGRQGTIPPAIFESDDAGLVTNVLATPMLPDVDDRQAMLECVHVEQRLDRLIERAAVVLAALMNDEQVH